MGYHGLSSFLPQFAIKIPWYHHLSPIFYRKNGYVGHLPRYSYPGSLPRALTLAERERVLRVLQPTATFEMLNRIPSERGCPGTWTGFFFGRSEMIEMDRDPKRKVRNSFFFGCHCAICCSFLFYPRLVEAKSREGQKLRRRDYWDTLTGYRKTIGGRSPVDWAMSFTVSEVSAPVSDIFHLEDPR